MLVRMVHLAYIVQYTVVEFKLNILTTNVYSFR